MIDLNGPSNPPLRTLFTPTYLYSSAGVEKQIFSNGGTHLQNSPSDGDYMIIPVYCYGTETSLELNWNKSNNRGIFNLYINGVLDSSGYDGYSSGSSNILTAINLTRPINPGWNEVKVVVSGKNASSSGHYVSVCGVRLR